MVDPTLQQNSGNAERQKELKAFDDTKAGVKGLVDSGITKVPQIFLDPSTNDNTQSKRSSSPPSIEFQVPVIDLKDLGSEGARKDIIDKVRVASEKFGFFQVVNHGIPKEVLAEMIEGSRRFHEQPQDVKEQYYGREGTRKVQYNSNFDLFQAKQANWRDSLFCLMAPEPPKPEEIPSACREILILYSEHVKKLGLNLLELMSEGLGLRPKFLEEMDCGKGYNFLCHYYPACPEPDKTIGATEHSDPNFFTILLQDHIGGLQVLYQNHWIDVKPVEGALVINLGDLLQLISNDKFKSAIHRVQANIVGPRISVPCFFSTAQLPSSKLYGPIKELVSEENPPLYKETTVQNYVTHCVIKGLGTPTTPLQDFRL